MLETQASNNLKSFECLTGPRNPDYSLSVAFDITSKDHAKYLETVFAALQDKFGAQDIEFLGEGGLCSNYVAIIAGEKIVIKLLLPEILKNLEVFISSGDKHTMLASDYEFLTRFAGKVPGMPLFRGLITDELGHGLAVLKTFVEGPKVLEYYTSEKVTREAVQAAFQRFFERIEQAGFAWFDTRPNDFTVLSNGSAEHLEITCFDTNAWIYPGAEIYDRNRLVGLIMEQFDTVKGRCKSK